MTEKRFPSVKVALAWWRKVSKRGVLIGMSSERIPMMEFECEDAKLCVMGLRDPLRIAENWVLACDRVFREVARWYGYLLAFVSELYQIDMKPKWEYALCPTKVGVRKAPFFVRIASKSIHVGGSTCIARDWYKRFYASLLGAEWRCVDTKYIEAVIEKGYATLRIVPKTADKARVTLWDIPRNIAIGELIVENLKPVLVVKEIYRPAWDFLNYIFVVFRQFGIDVEVLGFKARL